MSYEDELWREHERHVKRERRDVHWRNLLRGTLKALTKIAQTTGEPQTREIAQKALKKLEGQM